MRCTVDGVMVHAHADAPTTANCAVLQIHALAEDLKTFVPEKADEVLSEQEQQTLIQYINRQVGPVAYKTLSQLVP